VTNACITTKRTKGTKIESGGLGFRGLCDLGDQIGLVSKPFIREARQGREGKDLGFMSFVRFVVIIPMRPGEWKTESRPALPEPPCG